jgi:hypothetical protein
MENDVDIYTKGVLRYSTAVCSFKLGLGVKTEGNLVISGTKGYAYVPASWWKTGYFELRYEDQNQNKKYFYKWDGTEWQMLNEALTKNVGEYKVQVIVYADDTYKSTTVEEEFEVTKKVLSLPSEIEKTYDGTNEVVYNFDTTTTGTGEAVIVKVGLMEGSGYTPIKNVGTYTADFSGDFQFDEPHFFVGGNEVENYDLDSAFWGQTGEYEITINKKVISNFTYNTTYQADATTNGLILTLTSTHGVASGEYLFIKIDADDLLEYEAGQTYDLVLSESDAGNGKLVAYLSATNDNYTVDIETIKLRVS